ncbi:MAG: hypothetical protein JRJ54_13640 [Deltaproteobacteria bacterium]|nr:hypothetical protein [Deltaproteobacteria bacterium]
MPITGAEVALITAIIELIAKYGIPAAMDIIRTWRDENPGEITVEMVEALRMRVPHPDVYFDGAEGDPDNGIE